MRCFGTLIILLLAVSAKAELPFLEADKLGNIETVIVESGTINVGTLPPIVISSTVSVLSVLGIIQAEITVAGGTGFAVFTTSGTIRQCAIKAPTEIATYQFSILTEDADQFPIFSPTRVLTGSGSLMAPRIVIGSHRFSFTSATPDGTYKVRCGVRE